MFDQYRHTGRNPVRNAVVIVLFGAITIVFVFWGLMPKQAGMVGAGGSVAEVNGELISIADFENEIARLSQMYAAFLGKNSNAQRQMLAGQAINDLVQIELLAQEATRQGLYVSKEEIRDLIVGIPAFQKDGQFQKTYYEAYLTNIHSRPSLFEKRLRKENQFRRTNHLLEMAFEPLGPEAEKQAELNATKLNLQFLKVNREELAKTLQPRASEVEAFAAGNDNQARLKEFYDSHLNQFKVGEKTKSLDEAKSEIAQSLLAQDQAAKLIQDLETAVKKGDAKEVQAWATAHKQKWDETGDFPLSSLQIPKLGENQQLMKFAMALTPAKPLAAEVVRELSSVYVLKLKSKTQLPQNDSRDVSRGLVMRRSQEALGKYLEGLRATAEIRENSEYLKQ